MMSFSIKRVYQPMGDQPTAIAQLSEGLSRGEKEQVLLGVTGSGKSVTAESPVFIKKRNTTLQRQIGSVIDEVFALYPEHVKASGDSEYINTCDIPEWDTFQTLAFDPKTGKQGWQEVYQVSRHIAGDVVAVATQCGRSVSATLDHNFYCARDGRMKLVAGNELQVGDMVPIVRGNDFWPGPDDLEAISLTTYLKRGRRSYYVKSPQVAMPTLSVSAHVGRSKAWRVEHSGERIALEDWHASDGTNETALVGGYHQKSSLPLQMPVTDELLRLIGLYIAEGCHTKNYVVISSAEPEIIDEIARTAKMLSCNTRRRNNSYDYQLSSVMLADLLSEWCGTLSAGKKLPEWWPRLSARQLGVLLGAYYDGDGCMELQAITAATTSVSLASGLQYALQSLGVHARRRSKITRWKDGRKFPSYVVAVQGSEQLRRFASLVALRVLRKRAKLNAYQQRKPNTNVDVVPFNAQAFKSFRMELGLTQAEVAVLANASRTTISLIESGYRQPSQSLMCRLHDALHHTLAADQRCGSFCDSITALSGVRWARVDKIERKDHRQYVYDFAVMGYETFLTGNGGIYVHNTFTMANIIQNYQKPTLVLSHNKTLAAQLYSEFKTFFPDNAVHYFVSYFDYYQPEAYIARSDTYIEKDSQINEEIDRLRHAATAALLSRRDVIIVASVSCIYGIGSVDDYGEMAVQIQRGERRVRDKLLRQLTDIQYARNDIDFHRGTFRVRGDVVDVFPAGEEIAYRIEFFGDEVERITKLDPLTGEVLAKLEEVRIFPGSHYVTPQDKLKVALGYIERELQERLAEFRKHGKLLEAQRLEQRTRFDIEMLEETGFVKGIENYSRYLTNREPGEQPATLMDYFPDDFLMFIDESHMTMPQLRGMYNGDRARKEVLVEHGFRLPSALDNRPLMFTEFERHVNKVVYVSATPAQYELSRSPEPARQVIRPTGLLDPVIEVRPIEGQIDDLIAEIRATIAKRQRILVTTLTKRMAEDLTEYLQEINIKVTYLHSDVDTLDRTDILRDLRLGTYDVVVGINLLREGLDLPEVSLVAILDADKEGFLRSEQALIQTVGRAARHVEGRVVMYADRITNSMQRTLDETTKRRAIQAAYNTEHGITPTGIAKAVEKGMRPDLPEEAKTAKLDLRKIPKDEYKHLLRDLSAQMDMAAQNLEFEKAAELRDIIADIKKKM